MNLLDKYRELKLKHSIEKVCRRADTLIPVNGSKPKVYVYQPSYEKEGLMSIVCGVMGYLRYCLEHDLLLIVDMRSKKNSYLSDDEVGQVNSWDFFYRQPMCPDQSLDEILAGPHYDNPERTVHGLHYDRYIDERVDLSKYKAKILFPQQKDYITNREQLRKDCALYKKYFHLSDEAKTYVDAEIVEILPKNEKVLAVVCRGTDYVQLKPYNHNIQPAPHEILKKTVSFLQEHREYKYVYIATETQYAVDLFKKKLTPMGVRVLVNKRVYFDQYDFKDAFLSDIKMERERDEYRRGMEYFSSIHIVSRCDSLIAGLCGGSQMALIMNDFQYENVYLFDIGVYR